MMYRKRKHDAVGSNAGSIEADVDERQEQSDDSDGFLDPPSPFSSGHCLLSLCLRYYIM